MKNPLVQGAGSAVSECRHSEKSRRVFGHCSALSNIFNISALDGGDLHKFLINESLILKVLAEPLLSLFQNH